MVFRFVRPGLRNGLLRPGARVRGASGADPGPGPGRRRPRPPRGLRGRAHPLRGGRDGPRGLRRRPRRGPEPGPWVAALRGMPQRARGGVAREKGRWWGHRPCGPGPSGCGAREAHRRGRQRRRFPLGHGAGRDPRPIRHRSPEYLRPTGVRFPKAGGRFPRGQGRARGLPRSVLLCGEGGSLMQLWTRPFSSVHPMTALGIPSLPPTLRGPVRSWVLLRVPVRKVIGRTRGTLAPCPP